MILTGTALVGATFPGLEEVSPLPPCQEGAEAQPAIKTNQAKSDNP